jgi:hypothetical protein
LLNAAARVAKTVLQLGVAQIQMETKAALSAEQHPLLESNFSIALSQGLKLRLRSCVKQTEKRF